ncbi:MAG: universal stress protein, partial [Hyphomicrobiales bacterium]
MSYSSIMVHVTPSAHVSNRIKLAGALADRFGAALIGIAARPASLVAFNDHGRLEDRLIKHELKVASDQVEEAERLFRQVSGTRNLVEWRSTVGWPTPFLIEQARAADLIVVSREDIDAHEDERFGIDRADVLIDAGRPLLVTPPQLDSLSAERVVIAWKNTREARRAISVTLPLLKMARKVLVAGICDAREIETVEQELADVSQRLE